MPPDGRTGAAVDRYALACLQTAVFMPLTIMFPPAPGKAEVLVETITRHFPVPGSYSCWTPFRLIFSAGSPALA